MILSLLLACSTDLELTATVGKAGLQLDLPGGASLDIPEGALTEDVEITARLVTDLEASGVTAITEGFEAPAFAIALEPHGLTFAKPVTLTLPADGIGNFPEVMRAEYDLDPDWEGVGPVTVADGVATVEIDGFSVYALTLVKDGACPCFDRDDMETYYQLVAGTRGSFDPEVGLQQSAPKGLILKVAGLPRPHPSGEGCSAGLYAPTDPEPTVTATAAAKYFPGLTATTPPGARLWLRSLQLQSSAQYAACNALVRAGVAGDRGRALSLYVSSDMSATDTITVTDRVSGESYPLSAGTNRLIIPKDAAFDFSVTDSPAGLECHIDDGIPDFVDISCYHPPEVPCNLVDDDLDGKIDEDATDTVVDTDGDGLVDTCDKHPTLGCPCYDVSDVTPALAWTNAACVTASSTALPEPGVVFTGVAANVSAQLYGVLGTSNDLNGGYACAQGCFDYFDGTTTACAAAGIAPISATPLATEDEYEACSEVVEAGCF